MNDSSLPPRRRTGRGQASASDVARAAGVSISAVSRTFTPGASVSPRMRAKVLAAARELDYAPNALARSLMTQRSHLIGILMANFKNPFYLDVLDLFTYTIQQQGYHALVLNVAHGAAIEEAARLVMQYRVDGLVVTSSTLSGALIEECGAKGIPLVVFGRHPARASAHLVCCDNAAGGRLAAQLLIERGYKRLAFIGGSPDASTTIDRRKGFVDALKEAGIALAASETGGEYAYDAGATAAARLLALDPRPDAVFCADDVLALGVMDIARFRFGLGVPEDLGIVGFDDIPLASAGAYDLTTIRQPYPEMVRESVARIIAEIETEQRPPRASVFPPTVVIRNSLRQGRG